MMTDDAGLVGRWSKLNQKHSGNIDMTSVGLLRQESSCYEEEPPCKNVNNDQMISKTLVFNSYATQINNYQVEMMKNPLMKNIAIGDKRIWFSPQATHLFPNMESFKSVEEKSNAINGVPLIIHSPNDLLSSKSIQMESEQLLLEKNINKDGLENAQAMQQVEINLNKYTPSDLNFDVIVPSDGWLLVTDRWAGSWKVETNNKLEDVYVGNFIFRAIKVEKGNNNIHFYYQPKLFPYLLIISWGMLFIIIVFSAFFFIRSANKDKGYQK